MLEVIALAAALRVIDGDTFILRDERIRIANIDAPELHSPKCEWERQLAIISRDALHILLTMGPITIERQGQDRYGRTLAQVYLDGRDVGWELVDMKLAVPWKRRVKVQWCP